MTKKNILSIILDSVFMVAFNILFFLNGGTSHTPNIWTCYGFLHFAYLMVLITPLIESKGRTAYLSKLTTYSISLLYFLAVFLFALFVFFYNNAEDSSQIGIKAVVSIEVILAAVYALFLVSNLMANDATANKQARHDIENDFIKTISAKAKYIESVTSDTTLKNKISNLYYTIHSSPIRTSNAVTSYEEQIATLMDILEEAIEQNNVQKADDQIKKLELLVKKRNFSLTQH